MVCLLCFQYFVCMISKPHKNPKKSVSSSFCVRKPRLQEVEGFAWSYTTIKQWSLDSNFYFFFLVFFSPGISILYVTALKISLWSLHISGFIEVSSITLSCQRSIQKIEVKSTFHLARSTVERNSVFTIDMESLKFESLHWVETVKNKHNAFCSFISSSWTTNTAYFR